MSDSKVFFVPDGVNNGSNNSLDPNLLLALNQNGGFGGNGNFMWIIFLFFLYPLMRNGGFFGNNCNDGGNGNFGPLANLINNDSGRELLMQAINNNQAAIERLASMFGCKSDTVIQAINAAQSQIQEVGNKVGMSAQQIINAIQAGNCQLGQQIAQCCCENRLAICQQTNALQSAINNVTTSQERGFAQVSYDTQRQTCDLQNTIKDSTAQIIAGQRAAEMRELNRDIAERDRKIAEQSVIINNGQQTAIFGQMIQQATAPIVAAVNGLQKDVDGVKCKLPETATIPYSPVIGIPSCLAGQFALNNGFGFCGGFNTNGAVWG